MYVSYHIVVSDISYNTSPKLLIATTNITDADTICNITDTDKYVMIDTIRILIFKP